MAGWYKHDIAAWMDGTEKLSHAGYRAYHVICQLIYLNEGPIEHNEIGIAGRCNQHPLKFRHALIELVKLGKVKNVDGKLSNDRATEELNHLSFPRRPRHNLGSTPAPPPDHPRSTPPQSASQPLEIVGAKKQTRLDKTRLEKKECAAAPIIDLFPRPNTPPSPDKRYYDRAVEVLGPSRRSYAAKLLQSKNGDISRCMSILELAAGKSDPVSYIGGAMKSKNDGMPESWVRGDDYG